MIIALNIQNHIYNLQLALSEELKKKGHKIIIYTNNRLQVDYLKKNLSGKFSEASYLDLNLFINNTSVKKNYKKKQLFYERKMKSTYINFIATNRVFGIEYAIGSAYHPTHELSNVSYKRIISGINDYFDYWTNEIKQKKIEIIISGESEHYYIAKSNKIKFRSIERARYKNFHYWSKSNYKKIPEITKNYELISKKKKIVDIAKIPNQAYDAEFKRRKRNIKSFKLTECISRIFLTSIKHCYIYLYSTKFDYKLFSKLSLILRKYFHFNYLKKNSINLDELVNKKKNFVFYPLHTEPEPQIMNNSPNFFFQEALIALISRNLPSDQILIVKESITAIGRRDINFYKKINKFKNVSFINCLEEGVNVIKKSCLVFTISGTAGSEAAILGKPVISMSAFNDYNILEHVYHLCDLSKINNAIKRQIQKGKINKNKLMKDGYNYLLSLEKSSFDLKRYNHLETNIYINQSSKTKKILLSTFLKSIN